MSERLAHGEVTINPQGSEYQALLLDAVLQGSEAPVPPYQLVAWKAGTLVVRDIAIADKLASQQPSDFTHVSDPNITQAYRSAVNKLYEAQEQIKSEGQFSSGIPLEGSTELSLEGLCFSPAAVKLVDKWDNGLKVIGTPMSKHAALEAVTSTEGLQSVLRKVANAAPYLLLPDIPALSRLVPQQTIREWIDTVTSEKKYANARSFINSFHHIAHYFEGETEVLAERVKTNLSSLHSTEALEALANRPIISQYLTPDEARQITADKLATMPDLRYLPPRKLFDKLIEQDLAEPTQIQATIVNALKANQDSDSLTLQNLQDILSDEGIADIKAALLEQFNQPAEYDSWERALALASIVKYGFFSSEELKGVFETCIQRNESERLMPHLTKAIEVLSAPQLKITIAEAMYKGAVGNINNITMRSLLKKVDLPPLTRLELVKQATEQAYRTGPHIAASFLDCLPTYMHSRLIRDVINSCPVKDWIHQKLRGSDPKKSFAWLNHLGSPSEAAGILRSRIQQAHDLSFVDHVQNWQSDSDYLPLQLFSYAEAEAMVRHRLVATKPDGTYEYSSGEVLAHFDTISTLINNYQEMQTFVRERAYSSPAALFTNWRPEFSAFFNPDEVMDMLESVWPSSMVDRPYVNTQLQEYLPKDRLVELYSSHMALTDHVEDEDFGIDNFMSRLDPQDAKLFVQKLLDKNPCRLLENNDAADLLGLGKSELTDWINQNTSAFAPRSLAKIGRRYERANQSQQKLLAKDKDDLYQAFAWVNYAGLNDTYERLLKGVRTEKAERELLHLLSTAGRQINWYTSTAFDQIENLSDLRILIEDVTLRQLGVDTLTNTERTAFRNSITDILPFGVYASRYIDSEPHRRFLKEMLQSTTTPEGYKTWRFALDKTLSERKHQGWVPERLSEAQFDKWAKDDGQTITLDETPHNSVGEDISKLIRQNIEHLGAREGLTDHDTPSRLNNLIQRLGKELQKAHAERQQGRDAAISEIEDALKSSKYLRAAHTMYNAHQFTPPQIKQAMRDFRAGLPEDGRFLAGRVKEMLDFAGKTLEAVTITDTSDPQTTIEIGAKPVPSCQHYANGSANENLLGYFDVDVKPIIIRGETGGIVARAIMRLLQTESGDPVLYVEPTYSSYSQGQATQAIESFVVQKAAKIGIAYVSNDSNNNDDYDEEVVVQSRGSRAPERYSDSLDYIGDGTMSAMIKKRAIITQ